jgi:hypothetical protein
MCGPGAPLCRAPLPCPPVSPPVSSLPPVWTGEPHDVCLLDKSSSSASIRTADLARDPFRFPSAEKVAEGTYAYVPSGQSVRDADPCVRPVSAPGSFQRMTRAVSRFATGLLGALAVAALVLWASMPMSRLPDRCLPSTRALFRRLSDRYAEHTRAFPDASPPEVVTYELQDLVLRVLPPEPVMMMLDDQSTPQCPSVNALVRLVLLDAHPLGCCQDAF